MSDDLSNDFLQGRDADPELEADLARVNGDQSFFGQAHAGSRRLGQFGKRVGLNTLVAAYDTLRNVGELAIDVAPFSGAMADMTRKQPTLSSIASGEASKAGDAGDADLYDIAPEFMRAADRMRDEWAAGSGTADTIMQKTLQFAVPFTGAMKALGGMATAGKLGKAKQIMTADAITSGSVWDPHEGRFADLLRSLAPDSELVNAATAYLASDASDTDAEGRFKNILDSQLAGAAVGSFVFASASALRTARQKGIELIEKLARKPAEAK